MSGRCTVEYREAVGGGGRMDDCYGDGGGQDET